MENTQLTNKLKEVLLKGGFNIRNLIQLTSGEYNQVFKGELDNFGKVIIRIFRSSSWPEEGKLIWINKKLAENNIPNAEILFSTRKDEVFKKGFMIQKFVEGELVEDLAKENSDIYPQYYKDLGLLIKQIHQIQLPNYGYIGDGTGNHKTFEKYINRDIDRFFESNEKLGIKVDIVVNKFKEIVLDGLAPIGNLKPVLNHNDLSPNNVIKQSDGELVLIDWDNAVSNIWINDFAVMTYWMRNRHKNNSLRESLISDFLEGYKPDLNIRELRRYEKYFHLLQSFNLLGYYYADKRMDAFKGTLYYFNQLVEELG